MGRGSDQRFDDVVRVGFGDAWQGLSSRERLGEQLALLKSQLFSAGPREAEAIKATVASLYTDVLAVDPLSLQGAEEIFDRLTGYQLTEQGRRSKRGSGAFIAQLFFVLRVEDGFSAHFVRANPDGLALRYHVRVERDGLETVCGMAIDPESWTLRGKRGTATDRNALCWSCSERLKQAAAEPELRRTLAEYYDYEAYFSQEAKAVNAAARAAAAELIADCQAQGMEMFERASDAEAAAYFASELLERMRKAAVKKGCQLAAERLHEREIPERAEFFFAEQLYASLTSSPLGPELLQAIRNDRGRGLTIWPIKEIVAECFEMAVDYDVEKVWGERGLVELRAMVAVAAERWPRAVQQLFLEGKLAQPQVAFLEEWFNQLIPQARQMAASAVRS